MWFGSKMTDEMSLNLTLGKTKSCFKKDRGKRKDTMDMPVSCETKKKLFILR